MPRSGSRQRLLPVLLACTALCLPALACAQDPDDPAAPDADPQAGDAAATVDTVPVAPSEPPDEPSGPPRFDDLIVTSTKRAQPLRRIPGTTNVLDGRSLEADGAQELADFLKKVPGVSQNALGMDQNRVTIRGVGADTSRLTTSATTAILIGDTPFSDPMLSAVMPDVNPFDLEGVEVLKGPQGTLFGSSGLSGAIRYVPAAPQPGIWQGKLAGSYGPTREGEPSMTLNGAVNVPLGSSAAALRLVGLTRAVGGVVDDVTRGLEDIDSRRQNGGRALLRWDVTDRLSANALYLKQRSNMDELPFASNTEGRLERSTTTGPSWQVSEFDLANLGLGYGFDWGEVTSTTSRVTKDYALDAEVSRVLGTPQSGDNVRLFDGQAVRSWMQELRVVSEPGLWEWLAGVYGLDYHQDFSEILTAQSALPLPPSLLQDAEADIDLREWSVFGNAGRRLGEAFKLEVGLRYYRIRTKGSIVTTGTLVTAATGEQTHVSRGDIRESGLNPKLALSWFATPHLMGYASVARGFRTGGIQTVGDTPTTDVPDTYKSDVLWNYELGLRSDWLDRNLLVDVAVYLIDWKNPQMVQRTSDNLFNYVDNVGAARVPGIEVSTRWAPPVDGLTLTAAAAYSRPRTTEPFEAPDGTPVPVGTPLPGTGNWQAAGTLDYGLPIGRWLANAQLVRAYAGPAYNDLLGHARIYGYRTWDARIGVSREVAGLPAALSLIGSNLTDERGIANNVWTSDSVQDVFYIRPRTVELRLSVEY